MAEETVLKFAYPFAMKDKAKELTELLDNNGIDYKFYESDGYWPHEFVVRRSGRTWNDIMKMVNSVHAVRYRKEKTQFNEEGREVVTGTLHI